LKLRAGIEVVPMFCAAPWSRMAYTMDTRQT